MAVTQATVLPHLPCILQILPCQPLLQNASWDPTADCRDEALSQLPLQPNGETEGSKGEMMAAMGETGKQRNVEGKMGFLLADLS